jgi:hypothetical protein
MSTPRTVFGVALAVRVLAFAGCSATGSQEGDYGGSNGAGGERSGSGGSVHTMDGGGASGAARDAAVAAGGSRAAPVGVSKECLTCLASDTACGAMALSACKVVPTCGACLTDLVSKGAGSGCRDTPLFTPLGTCANQNCPDACAVESAGVWKP